MSSSPLSRGENRSSLCQLVQKLFEKYSTTFFWSGQYFINKILLRKWNLYYTVLRKLFGWIHEDPSTFLERCFFSIFFRFRMPVCTRKHFWWKKMKYFLLKIPSFWAIFRNSCGVFLHIEKLSRKCLELLQKLFFRTFLVFKNMKQV